MKIQISKNIRLFRKEKGYTQEQLAEALGVTVGAVSKWETGLSVPDIQLIVEMADFFHTSVDVLLGYQWREGSLGASLELIKAGKRNKDFEESVKEADKAIQRFPNNFDIIFHSGALYLVMGLDTGNKEALEKSVKLFKRSLDLIDQNEDPEIDVFYIKQRIASAYNILGRIDDSVAILKETNINGCNNGMLGYLLASFKHEYSEGQKYLSASLLDYIGQMIYTLSGFANIFVDRKEYQEAVAAMQVYVDFLETLKRPNSTGVLDRLQLVTRLGIVDIHAFAGNEEIIREMLADIYDKAIAFGKNEDYTSKQVRFCYEENPSVISDYMGMDIMTGIEMHLQDTTEDDKREIKSKVLSKIWEDIRNEREKE